MMGERMTGAGDGRRNADFRWNAVAPRRARVERHLWAVKDAGDNPARLVAALNAIRVDASLTEAERKAIHRAVAQLAIARYHRLPKFRGH